MNYISEPGTYIAVVDEAREGYLSEDDKGRILLRIPVVTEDNKCISWTSYLTTDAGKTRAAKAMVEALKCPANWAELLVNRVDCIAGKRVAVVVDYDRDGNGEIKTSKTGRPYLVAKYLNDPDRAPVESGKPVSPQAFATLAKELKAVSQGLVSDAPPASQRPSSWGQYAFPKQERNISMKDLDGDGSNLPKFKKPTGIVDNLETDDEVPF